MAAPPRAANARAWKELPSKVPRSASAGRRLGLALGELDKITDGKVHITESQQLGKRD